MTTCVLSKSVNLDLSPESRIDVTDEQAKLIEAGKLTLTKDVTCTNEDVSPINCTSYKICVRVGSHFLGAVGTCAPDNFNPKTLQCDPGYVCPQCTNAGFSCLSSSSFSYCSDALEVVVNNVICPTAHYCNKVCQHPCTKFVQNC